MSKINNVKSNSYYYKASALSFGSSKPIRLVPKSFSIENSGYHPFIQQTMKRLASYNLEHGIIFTRDGRLIKESIGTSETPFTSFEEGDQFSKLAKKNPGWIFLHNHPIMDNYGKPLPITAMDAYFGAVRGASEVVAVHPN